MAIEQGNRGAITQAPQYNLLDEGKALLHGLNGGANVCAHGRETFWLARAVAHAAVVKAHRGKA